jgi:hypothetical protein
VWGKGLRDLAAESGVDADRLWRCEQGGNNLRPAERRTVAEILVFGERTR